MPYDPDSDAIDHLPKADDVEAKRDLWAAAKEAALAKKQAAELAAAPPAPKLKRRVKLRKPTVATQSTEEEWTGEPVVDEAADYAPSSEVPDYFDQVPVAEEPGLAVEEVSAEVPEIDSRAAESTEVHEPVVVEKTITEPEAKAKTEEPKPPVAAPKEKDPDAKPEPKAKTPASSEKADEPKAKTDKEKGDVGSDSENAKPETSEEKHEPIFLDKTSEPQHELTPKEKFHRLWANIGGRYLTMSLLIHLGLLIIAGFVYFSYSQNERIDFLPGGGTQQGEAASQALQNQVTRKKTRWLSNKPAMKRIAVDKSMAEIKLPEAKAELLDMPVSRDFMAGGKMGSLGFGKAGAGGGFGNGIGVGGKSGITFTPLSMFGKKIVGRRIAVVMDVSKSMTPYLEDVVKELDRVAAGSPVILYYGCGLLRPDGNDIDETVQRTQAKDFERFWRIWQGNSMIGFSGVDLKKVTFPPKEKIPLEDLFRFFSRRNNTFYLDFNGMDYAWSALLCQEIRNADALYWFSDFEDNVDQREMKTVLSNIVTRKQRLYIHPQIHGSSFKQVVENLVIPSGGEVIEPNDQPKKGKKK